MKVLLLTQDITVKGIPKAYNTGFSLMVAQIAAALADEGAEVYVSSSSLTNGTTIVHSDAGKKQFVLLERKLPLLLKHLRLRDVPRAIRHALSSHRMSAPWRIKLLKYTLSIGFNIHLIRKVNPDVIFIHSLGPEVLPFLSAALQTRKPFVLALHGLFSEANKEDFRTQGEVQLLPQLLKKGMPLTVVGSGMRRKLLGFFGWKECGNIYVVPNALNDAETTASAPSGNPWTGKHRILAIGNLSENKNQLQILRAFALLPAEIRAEGQLCLIGKDATGGELQKEAERLGIGKACTFTGSLPHSEVFRWIESAGVVVLASKLEGFGLSIIEGYHYGVPAVCFSRIDAFEDLYHEKCMTPVHEYTDEALAHAILTTLERPWDKDFIRSFGEKFSNHTMAQGYLSVLQQAAPTELTEREFNRLVDRYLR